MGIDYSPESEHAKEMAKWEMRPTREVTQEMIDAARRAGQHKGVFEYREYPKAMYKATQTPTGIKLTEERISAASEVEERNLKSRGYRASQEDAIQVVEDANQALAVADANRTFHDKRMSSKAQAEAAAAEQETSKHLGEIPALPIKRRGRKAKVS